MLFKYFKLLSVSKQAKEIYYSICFRIAARVSNGKIVALMNLCCLNSKCSIAWYCKKAYIEVREVNQYVIWGVIFYVGSMEVMSKVMKSLNSK